MTPIIEDLFEDICDEVIKCDDRAPSVPDVILQVISEILAESSQLPGAVNGEENEIDDSSKPNPNNDSNFLNVSGEGRNSGVASITSSPPPIVSNDPPQSTASVSATSIARVISNYHISSPAPTDNEGK